MESNQVADSKGGQRGLGSLANTGNLDKPKTSHGDSKANPNKMTERERLQASLRQTLTEFKEQQNKL